MPKQNLNEDTRSFRVNLNEEKRKTKKELVDDMILRLDKIDPESVLDANEFQEYGIIYDEFDNQSIHPDDIELIDNEEEFEGTKKVLKKTIREILSMRYKRKSRLFLLANLKREAQKEDKTQKIKITATDLVMFNRRYEWFPKIGIYGKWRMRSDPAKFIKERSIVDRIRDIKEKKWALNRFKNRAEVSFKKKKFRDIVDRRLVGKSVDSKGKKIKE
jgi:hypothetical protein